MKELNTFRKYLTEGVTADEIASRVRKLGKEKGIEDEYIEDYIDELDGNFEPDAYENSTDKDLLDDLKSYIDLAEEVVKENYKNDYANSEEDYTDSMVMEKIIDIIKYHELDPSDVLEEIGQEFGINFEFGRG
jgi:uncharacterized membrane protein